MRAKVGNLAVTRLQAAGPVEKPANVFKGGLTEIGEVQQLLIAPTAEFTDILDAHLLKTVDNARAQARSGDWPIVNLLTRELMYLKSLHNRLCAYLSRQ